MSPTPEFGTQLIGQTENALGTLLDRELAGSGVSRPQWITLTVAVMSGGTLDRSVLVGRVAGALKTGNADTGARIDELVAAGLLQLTQRDGSAVSVTDAGSYLHVHIRAAVSEITQRLWGDRSADDLAIAGRVLGTVLERANAELAGT
jgi:hypothetical protein